MHVQNGNAHTFVLSRNIAYHLLIWTAMFETGTIIVPPSGFLHTNCWLYLSIDTIGNVPPVTTVRQSVLVKVFIMCTCMRVDFSDSDRRPSTMVVTETQNINVMCHINYNNWACVWLNCSVGFCINLDLNSNVLILYIFTVANGRKIKILLLPIFDKGRHKSQKKEALDRTEKCSVYCP